MSPIWVAPIEVIEALANRYDLSGRYADIDVCLRVAEDTLMARLVAGHLPSIASYVNFCAFGGVERELRGETVPTSFWKGWNTSRPTDRESDWFVGDFRFSHDFDWSSEECWGNAFEVRIDATAFPTLELACLQENQQSAASNSGKGRKPANWWPDFAEELAFWCLRNDPPDGSGTEGQSEIIKAVLDRMAKRGVEVPGRETVRPVINAVLKRFRSAGN